MIVKVVVGVLRRKDKLLLCQRPSGKPYSGYWEFPGGKIERGEEPLLALQRELKEELDIVVTKAKTWFEHQHQYPDKTVLLQFWLVEEFIGEPQAKEQQQLRWVDVKQMQTLKLLDANFAVMDQIKELFVDLHITR